MTCQAKHTKIDCAGEENMKTKPVTLDALVTRIKVLETEAAHTRWRMYALEATVKALKAGIAGVRSAWKAVL
jgi:hypothetical protein